MYPFSNFKRCLFLIVCMSLSCSLTTTKTSNEDSECLYHKYRKKKHISNDGDELHRTQEMRFYLSNYFKPSPKVIAVKWIGAFNGTSRVQQVRNQFLNTPLLSCATVKVLTTTIEDPEQKFDVLEIFEDWDIGHKRSWAQRMFLVPCPPRVVVYEIIEIHYTCKAINFYPRAEEITQNSGNEANALQHVSREPNDKKIHWKCALKYMSKHENYRIMCFGDTSESAHNGSTLSSNPDYVQDEICPAPNNSLNESSTPFGIDYADAKMFALAVTSFFLCLACCILLIVWIKDSKLAERLNIPFISSKCILMGLLAATAIVLLLSFDSIMENSAANIAVMLLFTAVWVSTQFLGMVQSKKLIKREIQLQGTTIFVNDELTTSISWIFVELSSIFAWLLSCSDVSVESIPAECLLIIARKHVIVLLQPFLQALYTTAMLLKSQKYIFTRLGSLELEYLLCSTVLSAMVMLVTFTIEAVAESDNHASVHWKLGVSCVASALLYLFALLPELRIVCILVLPKSTVAYYVLSPYSRRSVEELLIKEENLSFLTEDFHLGEGHFACVHKATLKINNKESAQTVAVKRIKRDADSTVQRQQLFEEAFFMSQCMNQENIVNFFGICQIKMEHVLVMEYINGGSLEEFLKKSITNTIYMLDMIGICRDVGHACAFLERKQIIHRDVKVDNCIMHMSSTASEMKPSYTVKLTDFGLARNVNSTSKYIGGVNTLAPIRYKAPECFWLEFTTKSDVWSFGLLIWQVFHFAFKPLHMFDDRQLELIICQKKETVVDHTAEDIPGIELPKEMTVLMKSCLSYDPDDRPWFKDVERTIDLMQNQCPDDKLAVKFNTEKESELSESEKTLPKLHLETAYPYYQK